VGTLASPVREHHLVAGFLLVLGAVLAGLFLAFDAENLGGAVAAVLLTAVIFGGFVWVFAVRRYAMQALGTARPAKHGVDVETGADTAKRLARVLVPAAVLLVGLWLLAPDSVAGVVLGAGAAALAAGRRMRGWEVSEDARLARVPRRRWTRPDEAGPARGAGLLDSRGFYWMPEPSRGPR